MNPFIFHVFGPFAITWYGFLVVAGVSFFIFLAYRDIRRSSIATTVQFFDCATAGTFGGLIGGKLLFLLAECGHFSISSWQDVASIALGGFAILGAIVGAIIGILFMIMRFRIDVLAGLDLGAAYALVAHGVARLGCFVSGCCYGVPVAAGSCGVVYTNPASLAPLSIPLVPTQLIMAGISFIGFFLCLWIYHRRGRREGLTFCVYVLWESGSRFVVDFWRGDRVCLFHGLSVYQWLALGIMALIGLLLYTKVFADKARRRW